MDRIALVVSIQNPQDMQVPERMRRKLRGSFSEVQIFQVNDKSDAAAVSVVGYDGVIVGASTSGASLPPCLSKWLSENVVRLNAKPFGFFSISPGGNKEQAGAPMDRMVVWFLESLGLRPHVAQEFEGAEEAKVPKSGGIFARAKAAAPASAKEVAYDWAAVSDFVDRFELAAADPTRGRATLPQESIRPMRPNSRPSDDGSLQGA